jgi:predicted DNA-binding protein
MRRVKDAGAVVTFDKAKQVRLPAALAELLDILAQDTGMHRVKF